MSFDKSGYRIFSQGQMGVAHDAAHRALDEGDYKAGRATLHRFLERRTGSGSEWLHLQWHKLVFELLDSDEFAALRTYDRHIRPHAARSDLVATDAPSALWRLKLAGIPLVERDFHEVRLGALRRSRSDRSAYVQLHDLLSLTGAGDVESLTVACAREKRHSPLRAFAWGCVALLRREYRVAATCFSEFTPRVGELGGSWAQNQLFVDIESATRRLANGGLQFVPTTSGFLALDAA